MSVFPFCRITEYLLYYSFGSSSFTLHHLFYPFIVYSLPFQLYKPILQSYSSCNTFHLRNPGFYPVVPKPVGFTDAKFCHRRLIRRFEVHFCKILPPAESNFPEKPSHKAHTDDRVGHHKTHKRFRQQGTEVRGKININPQQKSFKL